MLDFCGPKLSSSCFVVEHYISTEHYGKRIPTVAVFEPQINIPLYEYNLYKLMKTFTELCNLTLTNESSVPVTAASNAKMSLYQLQELASRQQEQIESTHRLIMNKEQRLNYLSSMQDNQKRPIFDYDQDLNHFKEKITIQEAKLRKLRLLKGQIQKQRCSNSNICSELETVKILFKEKEKELSVAMTKIEALSRQLDELRKGNISNSYSINGFKHPVELEKLRQELLYKTHLSKQNDEELKFKRNILYKRQADMLKIDQKINELQSRLNRKRQLNQQLSSQTHLIRDTSNSALHTDSVFNTNTFLRSSIGHSSHLNNKVPYNNNKNPTSNIATVEPLPRYKGSTLEYVYSQQFAFGANKQDPKYQTLPYNTKFNAQNNKNTNYPNTQKINEKLNSLTRTYHNLSDVDCDNMRNNVSRNDISLIINSRNENKDTSLEERPSPSGSSGSSDRISSSLNTYSYSDKISSNNQYFKNLDNAYRNECSITKEGGQFSRQYSVPNCNSVDNTEVKMDPVKFNSSESDNFYKPKPSVPVKPISTTQKNIDVVDNCNIAFEHKFLSNHRINKQNELKSLDSSGNSASNTTTKKTNIFFDSPSDEVNDVDNDKNHEIEQRTKVSEIVSKINNCTVADDSWEKSRRRPVMVTNEMENELRQDINGNQSDSKSLDVSNVAKTPGECDKTETKTSYDNSKSSDDNNNKLEQDLVNNNTNTTVNKNTSRLSKDTANIVDANHTKSPLKRFKSILKAKENKMAKIPLGRRVSFDPLALLLDASLEGELELVKKTSREVLNPSASNDEGITALHNATCAGHFEIVKYLVEIGCDVNVQDSDGWTPLHCAASCNNLVMIKFLVQSGACIFATTFSDHETAAEKCEEDEEGFDGCSQYLYGIQEKLGVINNGIVYAVYDYESENSDELCFKNGDTIQILRKGDEQEKDWWWAKMDNSEGFIPCNLIGLYPRVQPSIK